MPQHLKYSIFIHLEFCSTGITVVYVQTFLCYKLCALHVFVNEIILSNLSYMYLA